MHRRNFLRIGLGSAMAAAIGGSLLGRGSRSSAQPGKPQGKNKPPPIRACILLYMTGGPSQIDTFDPKPGSANAGGVTAIGTKVSGMQFSELLPLLAGQAKQLAVIRSVVSSEGNHSRARHLMHTGYVPAGGITHPSFGAITASELSKGPLPGYVSINGPGFGPGFLGANHGPFAVRDPSKPVRNLARPGSLDETRFDTRVKLWGELEDRFAKSHDVSMVRDQRALADQALSMMRATEVVAFDLDQEPDSSKQAYGTSRFGLGCLMARRLVEAGVPFIEVMQEGWDTHDRNLDKVKVLAPDLDRGMSALLADLASRGLLDSTLVVWAGDFGRTPTINDKGGRDHYPQVTPVVLAGGGVKGGQVIGKTDADGVAVTDDPQTVPDLYASIAKAVGLDPEEERTSPTGRPITTVDKGTVIKQLF